MGSRERNTGARWERQAKKFAAELTGHLHWRRTDGGEKQWNGDLIPCNGRDGPVDKINAGKFYVECKFRKKIQRRHVKEWIRTIIKNSCGDERRWLLLIKQDGGPIIVFDSTLPKDENGYYMARITWFGSE
ncbi:hypothetical protein LCGC14_0413920 [marine sediment metagenome]|uniref:Uncharacterized protein n=1 Tax=marine sediment metagenome TaxID=412755 RepID=A0A0F9VEU7_9ZZZZ